MRISDWSSDVCSSDLNNDLKNISGTILGTGENSKVALSAGRDIVLETRTIAGETIRTADTIASKRVNADRIATVQGGDVTLDAGRDMIGKASAVLADKDLDVVAGRDITVGAVERRSEGRRVGKGGVRTCRSRVSADH